MNYAGAPRYALPRGWPLCALAAERLLRDREERYPALIEQSKLSVSDAAARIAIARALVAQWRWLTDLSQPDLPPHGDNGHFGVFNYQIVEDLGSATTRARAIAGRAPADAEAAMLADLYASLAWLQRDEAGLAFAVMDEWARRSPRPVSAAGGK